MPRAPGGPRASVRHRCPRRRKSAQARAVDRVAVPLLPEASRAHVRGISPQRIDDGRPQVGERPGESGSPRVQAEEVVPDQHLPAGSRPGPDSDRGDVEPLRDCRGHRGGDRLKHEREAAGALQGQSVLQEAMGAFGGASLGSPAAQRHLRLRRDSEMPHHRDPGVGDRGRARGRGSAALELDDVGAGLLDESLSGLDGQLV